MSAARHSDKELWQFQPVKGLCSVAETFLCTSSSDTRTIVTHQIPGLLAIMMVEKGLGKWMIFYRLL